MRTRLLDGSGKYSFGLFLCVFGEQGLIVLRGIHNLAIVYTRNLCLFGEAYLETRCS